MPRAKPKVTRVCLVCDTEFLGTPAATRCDPCKEAGHKVPAHRQRERSKKPAPTPEEIEAKAQALREKQAEREAQRLEREAQRLRERMITKTCAACGDHFQTTRKNAVRCDPCVSEGRKATYRSCLECGSQFAVIEDGAIRCSPCADLLGIDQYSLTAEQEEQLREERRKARWKEQLEAHREWLDRREKAKPKGYRIMSEKTRKTPLGMLWVELCAADGAASSISHRFDLTEDEKLHLISTYHRLRLKGFHPSALANLCPKAILEKVTEEAVDDLPEVTEEDPEDDLTFDPLEDLSDELRAEIIAFQEQQNRHADAIRLGLAS